MVDAYPAANPDGIPNVWPAGDSRIDYVLVERGALVQRIVRAAVHGKGPERGGFLGSDHCPLLVALSPWQARYPSRHVWVPPSLRDSVHMPAHAPSLLQQLGTPFFTPHRGQTVGAKLSSAISAVLPAR